MSLLDRDLEEAIVYPDIDAEDYNGNPVRKPDLDNGIPVLVRVKTPDATEAAVAGQSVQSVVRVMSRGPIPAGAFSVVDLRGRRWDVQGVVARHRRSPATAHDAMTLVTSTPEAPHGG